MNLFGCFIYILSFYIIPCIFINFRQQDTRQKGWVREREGEDFVIESCLSQLSVVFWQKACVWTVSKPSVWKAAKGSTKEQAHMAYYLSPFTFHLVASYFMNLKSCEKILSHPVYKQLIYSTGTAWQNIPRSPELGCHRNHVPQTLLVIKPNTATFWLAEISVGLCSNHQSFNSLLCCTLRQSINTKYESNHTWAVSGKSHAFHEREKKHKSLTWILEVNLNYYTILDLAKFISSQQKSQSFSWLFMRFQTSVFV